MTTAGGAPGTARDGYRAATAEPTGELREALAEWLFRYNRGPLTFWHEISEAAKDSRRDDADQLLSGPLAPLLAKLRAVEALLPVWNESYEWRNAGGPDVAPHEEHVAQALWVAMGDLRRALAAPQTGQHTTDEEQR